MPHRRKSIQMTWVVVKDLAHAVDYYQNSLGLTLKERNNEYGWAELAGDEGTRLGLAEVNQHTPFPPGHNAVVCFTVEDIKKTREEFKAKGVNLVGEITEVPGVVMMQSFRDPDGNYFQICQMIN